MKQYLAFLCLSALALSPALAQQQPSAPRIVPCDQPVKSAKRGICLNEMSAADFTALAPSVSWWYNWHFKDTQNPPASAKMEFLPMAWGDREEDVKGLDEYLRSAKPSRVLAINEPNLKGQAFISPEKTAILYKKIKAVADKHKIPVVGPHMALGSPEGSSITAMDPIEKKRMTYTFLGPFLKAFMHYMGDVEIPATASHAYGNFGEVKWMTEMLHKDYGRPVWVTEFAWWDAPNVEAEIDYMIESVDFFERAPYVEGYAWFKERVKGNPKLSLLGPSGKLTPLGEAYVNMPVHDPSVFYQLPGRLQSESYTEGNGVDMGRTKDTDGFLEIQSMGSDNWLDYQVASPRAGKMPVKVRFAGKPDTRIEFVAGDRVVGTVSSSKQGWQTAVGEIELATGNQKIRVRPTTVVRLNWMEFGAR